MKIPPALLLRLSATIAQATLVTYSFSGSFTAPSRSAFGPGNNEPVMWDLVSAGERFSGRFKWCCACRRQATTPSMDTGSRMDSMIWRCHR